MPTSPKPEPVIRLYPEYNLSQIELLYHDALAALNIAAEEKVGDDRQKLEEQIGKWYDRGKFRAAQSATLRRQRNLILLQTSTVKH